MWRKCGFCAHNFSFSGYRGKAPSSLAEELAFYGERYDVRHFYFADQYLDARYLERFADELLSRRMKIFFHFMGRPTSDYTPERLEKIARAGCSWISWGVESGSQRLLDTAGKGTVVSDVLNVLRNSLMRRV